MRQRNHTYLRERQTDREKNEGRGRENKRSDRKIVREKRVRKIYIYREIKKQKESER